jgi:hypothetical protein
MSYDGHMDLVFNSVSNGNDFSHFEFSLNSNTPLYDKTSQLITQFSRATLESEGPVGLMIFDDALSFAIKKRRVQNSAEYAPIEISL